MGQKIFEVEQDRARAARTALLDGALVASGDGSHVVDVIEDGGGVTGGEPQPLQSRTAEFGQVRLLLQHVGHQFPHRQRQLGEGTVDRTLAALVADGHAILLKNPHRLVMEGPPVVAPHLVRISKVLAAVVSTVMPVDASLLMPLPVLLFVGARLPVTSLVCTKIIVYQVPDTPVVLHATRALHHQRNPGAVSVQLTVPWMRLDPATPPSRTCHSRVCRFPTDPCDPEPARSSS